MDPVPSCRSIKKWKNSIRTLQKQLHKEEAHPMSLPERDDFNEKNR